MEQPWMRQHLSRQSRSCFCCRECFENSRPFNIPCHSASQPAMTTPKTKPNVRQFHRGREVRRNFPWTAQVLCQEAHRMHRDGNGAEFSACRGEKWESKSTSWSGEQYCQQAIGDSDQREISTAEGCMPWTVASAPALSRGDVQVPVFWHQVSHRFLGSSVRNGTKTPMTKALFTFAAATARRRRHRHCIGRLRDQIVSPKALTSYKQHTARFLSFSQRSHLSLLRGSLTLDALLYAFVEQIWNPVIRRVGLLTRVPG